MALMRYSPSNGAESYGPSFGAALDAGRALSLQISNDSLRTGNRSFGCGYGFLGPLQIIVAAQRCLLPAARH